MSYETSGVVLKAGISAAIQAGSTGPLMDVAGFRIGSASAAEGAVALETDTDVDDFVFAGDTSMLTYNQIDEDTLVWIIALPRSVGDFDVGNICVTLAGGVNLCKAVLPGQSPKYRDNPPAVVGNYKIYNIVMHLANAAGAINLSVLEANNASLPEVPTELDLPAPNSTPYNAWLVRNHTHIGQPCIAVRVANAWTFSPHYTDPNTGLGVVAVSPTMFMSSDAYGSKTAPALGPVGWNKTAGQFVAADGASQSEMPVGVRISTFQVLTLGTVSRTAVGINSAMVVGADYYAGTGVNTGKLSTTPNGPWLGKAVSANDIYIDAASLWRDSIANTTVSTDFIEANSLFIDVSGDTLDVDLKPGSVVYAYMSGLNRVWSRSDPLDNSNPIRLAVGVLNNTKKRVIIAGLVKITASPNDLPGALTVGSVLVCGGGADKGKVKVQSYTDSFVVGQAVAADTINVRLDRIASLAQHLLGARHDLVTTPYGVAAMINAAIAGINIPDALFPLDYDTGNNRYYIHNADRENLGVSRAATDLEVTNHAVDLGSNTPYPWITPQQIPLILAQVPTYDPWGTGVGAIANVTGVALESNVPSEPLVGKTLTGAELQAGKTFATAACVSDPCSAGNVQTSVSIAYHAWHDARYGSFAGTWTVKNVRQYVIEDNTGTRSFFLDIGVKRTA